MRIRFLQMCAIVVLLSVCVLAQRGPTSPLATPSGNEVSASFVLVAKDTSMNLGNGSYFTATHYFTQHIGLTGNGEFLHVNAYNLDEKLLMLGATYNLFPGAKYQPWAHFLAGGNWITCCVGKRARSWDHARTFEPGAGVDIRLHGPLYAKIGIDYVDSYNAHWQHVQGVMGFSYHFGEQTE